MGTKTLTKLVLAATTVGLIGYDVFVAVEPTQDDTISEVINLLAADHPILPFAWGVLTGHLFLRKDWNHELLKSNARYGVLAGSGILVTIASFLSIIPDVGAGPWLLAGTAIGWLFWPQYKQNFPN